MESWKEVLVGVALGLISLSSLINIKRFLTGEDTTTINVFNPDKVEVVEDRRTLDLETIASWSSTKEDENVE